MTDFCDDLRTLANKVDTKKISLAALGGAAAAIGTVGGITYVFDENTQAWYRATQQISLTETSDEQTVKDIDKIREILRTKFKPKEYSMGDIPGTQHYGDETTPADYKEYICTDFAMDAVRILNEHGIDINTLLVRYVLPDGKIEYHATLVYYDKSIQKTYLIDPLSKISLTRDITKLESNKMLDELLNKRNWTSLGSARNTEMLTTLLQGKSIGDIYTKQAEEIRKLTEPPKTITLPYMFVIDPQTTVIEASGFDLTDQYFWKGKITNAEIIQGKAIEMLIPEKMRIPGMDVNVMIPQPGKNIEIIQSNIPVTTLKELDMAQDIAMMKLVRAKQGGY